jgi:cell division protein FtsL
MPRAINWILMLATLASAFALYAIKYDTRRLEAKVQAQERSLEKAENDMTILMAERAHLARPERLEPLARQLGLAPITGGQYLRIDGDRLNPSRGSPPHRAEGASSTRRGEGLGVGGTPTSNVLQSPPPLPSPTRGEGAPLAASGRAAAPPSAPR